jgi:hypothetical protein
VFETSHGFDSAVVVRKVTAGPPTDQYSVAIYDSYLNAERQIATIPVPVSNSTSAECVAWRNELWIRHADGTTERLEEGSCGVLGTVGSLEQTSHRSAFAPLGGRVLVAVTKDLTQSSLVSGWGPCPWATPGSEPWFYVGVGGNVDEACRTVGSATSTTGAAVFAVTIQGGSVAPSWPAGTNGVFWLGVSEQGHEVVLGEGHVDQISWFEPDPIGPAHRFRVRGEAQVLSNCGIAYRELASGTSRAATVPTDEVCKGRYGHGTISPAPPVSSGGP